MPLTEEQIERRVERITDNADRRLMSGSLTQEAYGKEMADLNKWAEGQYAKVRR